MSRVLRPLALVGATATGKTALALELADALGDCELVSVDAMAVYRRLDIGTAKPTVAQRAAAVWHLVDLAEPNEEFSVARFQRAGRAALAAIAAREHRPLLVGGTGLYHRAVLDDLALPGRYPEVAAALADQAARPGGLEQLYERLTELDPLAASRIEPGNVRRIVRALEVTVGSGRPFSASGPGLTSYAASPFLVVGLRLERAVLDRRIEDRLDAQLAAGFLDEVAAVRRWPGFSRTAGQALGYRELLAHLEGQISLDDARAETLRRTRSFARRQESWFRRDPRVVWLDAEAPDLLERIVDLLATGGEPGREGRGGRMAR